ncbi:MAG: NAD-dependent deacylase [Cytophagales bacterium]
MQKLVVLTGAGISAESGLKTFRDSDGLWEGFDVMEVASFAGWQKNPQLVLDFYNMRFSQGKNAEPNKAHLGLKQLEQFFDVQIITQNVDDLHEKAGSSKVLHLHGKLTECKSSKFDDLIYPYPVDGLKMGDLCEKGFQLRPNIVWFGEAVPMFEKAMKLTRNADIFVVIGTSLQVYPAAGLVHEVPYDAVKFLIDKQNPGLNFGDVEFIKGSATEGVEELISKLTK